jgi:hypothetical protein
MSLPALIRRSHVTHQVPHCGHMSNTSGAHSPVTCHTSGATLWSHVKYIRRSFGGHMSHPSGGHTSYSHEFTFQ